MIPVISPNYFMQKASYMQAKLIADTITPMLLHDLSVASDSIHYGTLGKWWLLKNKIALEKMHFRGYWQNNLLRSSTNGILVSSYEGEGTPYERIIVIGNMTRSSLPTGVILDNKHLGLSARDLRFYNLFQNETPISAESVPKTLIQGGHFLLIGVKTIP